MEDVPNSPVRIGRTADNARSALRLRARTLVWPPDGTFRVGSDHHYPEEAPVHRVTVSPFWVPDATKNPHSR